jgi:hypothetical protein
MFRKETNVFKINSNTIATCLWPCFIMAWNRGDFSWTLKVYRAYWCPEAIVVEERRSNKGAQEGKVNGVGDRENSEPGSTTVTM